MKNLLSLATFLLACTPLFSQEKTHLINGQNHFIYPYQETVTFNRRVFRYEVKSEEKIKRDSLNRTILSTEVKPVTIVFKAPKTKDFKRKKKIFYSLRQNHSGFLCRPEISLEKDVTPTLQPLKDGLYVQYYRDVPYVDEANVLRYKNDVIAAIFHLTNNQLDGQAVWFHPNGDTLKKGTFINGLKTGEWRFFRYEINDPYSKKATVEEYVAHDFTDTSLTIKTYVDGLANGPYTFYDSGELEEKGFFKNGVASGEWFEYDYKKTGEYSFSFPLQRVLVKHYTLIDKPLVAHGIIIRDAYEAPRSLAEDNSEDDFGFFSDYRSSENFSDLYSVHVEKEEAGLELPEEKMRSYPGQEEEGEFDFDQRNIRRSSSSSFYSDGKKIFKNKILDSIGYETKYTGLYEEFHSNGALRFRCMIKNGKIEEPDTIFWEDGKPMNVLSFLADSNQFIETKYTFDGALFKQAIYSKEGEFLRFSVDEATLNYYLISGLPFTTRDGEKVYRYSNFDTLEFPVKADLILSKTLWKVDSSLTFVSSYNKANRAIHSETFAISGKKLLDFEVSWTEDFESLNAKETFQYKEWSSEGIFNGAYMKNPLAPIPPDSLLTQRIRGWQRSFDVNSDYVLYYKGQAFSGSFELVQNTSSFKISGDESHMNIQYVKPNGLNKQSKKIYEKFRKKKKLPKEADFYNEGSISGGSNAFFITNNLINNLSVYFDPLAERDLVLRSYNEKTRKYSNKKVSEKQAHAFNKRVVGQFLNGKPEGKWITYDQFGNIMVSLNYKNGELDGEVLRYDFAYPRIKNTPYDELTKKEKLTRDSLPNKPVYYLYSSVTMKNGLRNGPTRIMTWYGDTTGASNYVDGRKEGPSYERSRVAFTQKNYEGGSLDGINRTYLTIPGRDTMLLFDLNFQNGQLQGESKSYHLNGNVAKKGFFLNGDPIDDFEAFDTLGFKYQYVKFQYNQPIEEKIWEENELSVRYQFDWRDSIPFRAEEITSTTSVERLLNQLGFNDEGALRPYYGRPSLVTKTGINYHLTKYYPNDTIARDGSIEAGKKVGCWNFWSLEGKHLYQVDYFDTILVINDSVKFKSKGVLTFLDANGQDLSKSWIVEKVEKYDCSHSDHHEVRMLYCFWEKDTTQYRINGYVKNYYDNGVLMNEGYVKNGLATGVWKFYDPYGSLNMVGEYILGKRNGRWLKGDLAQAKYMGDVCLNPNLPNLEEIMSYEEKLLDISVIYYRMSAVKKKEYYGINMNADGPPENYEDNEDEYYEGDEYEYEESEIRLR